MTTENPVNTELLPGNNCFGCGSGNPGGLHISVFRDPQDPERLLGRFTPRADLIGFPGITHGGAIYTALDCMASWSGMVLRKRVPWVLRSVSMTYHRPALASKPMTLSTAIVAEDAERGAIQVQAEARDADGNLLAEGRFKMIPLALDKFITMTGLNELPANWAALLADGG